MVNGALRICVVRQKRTMHGDLIGRENLQPTHDDEYICWILREMTSVFLFSYEPILVSSI